MARPLPARKHHLSILVLAEACAATLTAERRALETGHINVLDMLIRERNTAADTVDYPSSWLAILSAAEHSLPTLSALFLICCYIQHAQTFW